MSDLDIKHSIAGAPAENDSGQQNALARSLSNEYCGPVCVLHKTTAVPFYMSENPHRGHPKMKKSHSFLYINYPESSYNLKSSGNTEKDSINGEIIKQCMLMVKKTIEK